MTDDTDGLAQALSDHDRATREYVRVEQSIRDSLPPVRRRRGRATLLAVLAVLVLAAPLAIFTGRAHFVPAAAVASFPNASNTGVPAGTSLTSYGGSCTITTDNTVITAKIVTCDPLEIRAANVAISNSTTHQIWLDTDLAGASAWNFTLTDSEVTVTALINQATVCCGDYVITRSELQGGDYSSQCEMGTTNGTNGVNCTIKDSYLHGQNVQDGQAWHAGGFISEGGPNVLDIDHNYIVCDVPTNAADGGCTGDLNLLAWYGTMQDATIHNNFFGTTASTPRAPGGGPTADYCTYGGSVVANPTTTRVKFINNTYEKGVNGVCGASGPMTNFNIGDVGNEWTGNVYDDGTPVPSS